MIKSSVQETRVKVRETTTTVLLKQKESSTGKIMCKEAMEPNWQTNHGLEVTTTTVFIDWETR